MPADVIDFATRQLANTLPQGPDDPAKVCLFSPSLEALPFYTLPAQECRDGNDYISRHAMWNDGPYNKGYLDRARGRQYAREAVAAIIKDGARSHCLERLVWAIIDHGFKRRGPGGRLCRQLSTTEEGFLFGLCEIAVARAARGTDVTTVTS